MPDEPKDQDPQNTPPADWRSALPEDLRGEKLFESIKGKDWGEAGPTLAKGYAEAQRMLGGSIRVPKDDAPPEEWTKFYAKLGRPEKPEDYQLQPGELPEGLVWKEELAGKFAETAHNLGLTVKQAQGILQWYTSIAADEGRSWGDQRTVAEDALKKEWGSAFDRNLALAQRAVAKLGGEELQRRLIETGLGNDPVFVRLFARLAPMIGEDRLPKDERGGELLSQKDAQTKIAEVMNNPKHPYFNADDPGHKDAVKHVQALFDLAYQ